jgi:hypothetical protein
VSQNGVWRSLALHGCGLESIRIFSGRGQVAQGSCRRMRQGYTLPATPLLKGKDIAKASCN